MAFTIVDTTIASVKTNSFLARVNDLIGKLASFIVANSSGNIAVVSDNNPPDDTTTVARTILLSTLAGHYIKVWTTSTTSPMLRMAVLGVDNSTTSLLTMILSTNTVAIGEGYSFRILSTSKSFILLSTSYSYIGSATFLINVAGGWFIGGVCNSIVYNFLMGNSSDYMAQLTPGFATNYIAELSDNKMPMIPLCVRSDGAVAVGIASNAYVVPSSMVSMSGSMYIAGGVTYVVMKSTYVGGIDANCLLISDE